MDDVEAGEFWFVVGHEVGFVGVAAAIFVDVLEGEGGVGASGFSVVSC